MFDINGKYATAKVYAQTLDNETVSQIMLLCCQEFVQGSTICIMPDAHKGAGCTIGTTMTIADKVVPNLVGVDIGCGMNVSVLAENTNIDMSTFDKFVHKNVPAGHEVNQRVLYNFDAELNSLRCRRHLRNTNDFFNKSIGSLGGGNHFIELDTDDEGRKYLIVHSGSRNLGKQVAEFYQDRAYKALTELGEDYTKAVATLTEEYKAAGKKKQLADAILELRKQFKREVKIPKDLAYAQGDLFDDYMHDMAVVQFYAELNRRTIAGVIIEGCDLQRRFVRSFQSVHNYIDTVTKILRKGAIEATTGKELIIPLNMRDGCIIGIGKGNSEWNFSAPHGAGRILSRSQAKERLDVGEFKKTMEGIYTTCVGKDTLDESPMAYKPAQEIIDVVGDTIEIQRIVKPIYNFKASE